MSDQSDLTDSHSGPPSEPIVERVEIISSSSSSSSSSSDPEYIPELLEPIAVMSSSESSTISESPTLSARLRENDALEAFAAREAARSQAPWSPHDSPQNGPSMVESSQGSERPAELPLTEQEEDPDYGRLELEEPTLSANEVAQLTKTYSILVSYEPRDDEADNRACRPPPGFVGRYKEQLVAGLRFPILAALVAILTHFRLRITQVHSNSIRLIVGFMLYCRLHELPFSLALFRMYYVLKASLPGWYYFSRRPAAGGNRELFYGVPSSIKDWKGNFFFVRDIGLPSNVWREGEVSPDPCPEDMDGEVLAQLAFYKSKIYAACFSTDKIAAVKLARSRPSEDAEGVFT